MALFSSIVCCINLTDTNDDIIQYTKDMAKVNNANILVAHAVPSLTQMLRYVSSPELVLGVELDSKETTQKYLKEFVEQNFSGFNAEPVLLEGDITQELLALVDDRCADLVIMGSTSTSGLMGMFMSQPSEKVAGRGRIPVLVVPNELNLDCVMPSHA